MKNLKQLLVAFIFVTIIPVNAQRDSYTFEYIYKLEIETPRGRKTVLDYYLPLNGGYGYFGAKTKAAIQVFDGSTDKMYMYMEGKRDEKGTIFTMPFKIQKFVKALRDEKNIVVYKSAGYGNLLGHRCRLYKATGTDFRSEIWVATDIETSLFTENVNGSFEGYLLGASLRLGDDSLEVSYQMPLLIIHTEISRRGREKTTTMRCIKYEKAHLEVKTSDYSKLF